MTAKIIEFFSKWKDNQEKIRKARGFPPDLWYFMHEQGYDPTKSEEIDEFIKDLDDE
jgi:hypothetical protein